MAGYSIILCASKKVGREGGKKEIKEGTKDGRERGKEKVYTWKNVLISKKHNRFFCNPLSVYGFSSFFNVTLFGEVGSELPRKA